MSDIRELNDADLDGVSGAGPAVASKAAATPVDSKAALAAATKPTAGSVAAAVGGAPTKGAMQVPSTLAGNVTKDVAAAAAMAVPGIKPQGKG